MSLSIGIVGLPNVGKSTLFNALLKRQVALAANYPFATIDPNTGVVPVPDDRLDVLAKIVHTSVIKPATVEFVDIAGLVKGAHAGEGLGNQFLSHIREVDLIAHVIRGFSDSKIIREGSSDPVSDKETIQTELLLADLSTLEKQKQPKATKDPELLENWTSIEKFRKAVGEGVLVAQVANTLAEKKLARELGLLTAKAMIFVVNVDEQDLKKDQKALCADFAKIFSGGVGTLDSSSRPVSPDQVMVVSAQIESELSSLSLEDQVLYLKDLGLEKSGLERLIIKTYQLLGLQSFLTAGELEVRAWTIRAGTKAPQAAAVIHTDFEKNFIKAKISSYQDFVALDGWKGVKEKGKLRLEGKDYLMQEGDVVEFMIGG